MTMPHRSLFKYTPTLFSGLTMSAQSPCAPARRRIKAVCRPQRLAFLLLTLILSVNTASAEQLKLSFAEVAQTADLIFVGTVSEQSSRLNDKKTMVFTDVLFKDIQIVHGTEQSAQKGSSTVRLTYAGGSLGGVTVAVSDTPKLITGRRYLIFMLDDGQSYASPIIGAHQGLFEVIKDTVSQEEYVLTAGGKSIIGVNDEGFIASQHRVSSINGGVMVAEADQNGASARIESQPATSADGKQSQREVPDEKNARPLTLGEFLNYVKNVSLKRQLKERLIKRSGTGFFYNNNGGKVEAKRIQTSAPPTRIIALGPGDNNQLKLRTEVPRAMPNFSLWQAQDPSVVAGGTLGACGYHNLDLVMEQVPAAWPEWSVNNDNMYVWNQAMDIYRYYDDDGSWGDNSTNEFAGYPSNADVNDQYGFGWGAGALAMTITSMGFLQPTCGKIVQSDICWNPAFSWTNDFNVSLDGTTLLLRPINMHELGHSWGEQRGTYAETYDYDEATVMQPYYNNIIEDGWGIHASDAYLIRRIYDDQRGINGAIRDVGVESYYGSNGLNNSTTDGFFYTPGQSITLNNVLVENMTYAAVSDLRIRFFLSSNKIISTADYEMGSYWYWTSFCAECRNVSSYPMTIPSNIPPGDYYVGAIVTIDGFNNDDLLWNNRTYFYNTINVSCAGSYSLSSGGQFFESGGAGGSVDVIAAGGSCAWTANSDSSWLTITSGNNGNGNGTIGYSVAANTGSSSRTATIMVEGQVHTVTQAAGCLSATSSPIDFGQTANGSLLTSDCLSPLRTVSGSYKPYADRYRFYGVAGQEVAISLSSVSFDTYLYLIGPGGSVIASNDDGGGGTNSRIPASSGNFVLPGTGTYIIEATSFDAGDIGNYALSLIGTPRTFRISGTVTRAGTTQGISTVTMTLTSPTPAGFAPRTVTTYASGNYLFANLPAGRNYTVTPSKTNYSFTPVSRTYSALHGDKTTAHFTATLRTYSISGTVTRAGTTQGISTVTMTLTSPTPAGFAPRTVTTYASGNYLFANLPAGRNYTIRAAKTGFTFSPSTRSIFNLSADVPRGTATSFTGTSP